MINYENDRERMDREKEKQRTDAAARRRAQ